MIGRRRVKKAPFRRRKIVSPFCFPPEQRANYLRATRTHTIEVKKKKKNSTDIFPPREMPIKWQSFRAHGGKTLEFIFNKLSRRQLRFPSNITWFDLPLAPYRLLSLLVRPFDLSPSSRTRECGRPAAALRHTLIIINIIILYRMQFLKNNSFEQMKTNRISNSYCVVAYIGCACIMMLYWLYTLYLPNK